MRDEDYVYMPYIFNVYGTWEKDGVYIAIPLKRIERIESEKLAKNLSQPKCE